MIDESELRIETGMLTKRSRRIGFNRIQSVDLVQPLAARIFSLAELRIEAGAGEGARIRYLTRKDASRLRDYLLARAHGQADASVDTESTADAFADRAVTDRPLVRLQPPILIGGLLLSPEFLFLLLLPAAVLVLGLTLDFWLIALPALIPYAFGVVSMISRRVVNQVNFSLADTGRGLRITRGLTNLTSQSVPLSRIQGLRVRQPLLWRIFDWYRVDIDVLGYGANSDETDKGEANGILLPVGTREQMLIAVRSCLPEADHEAVPVHPIPRRARWLRWWNFWTVRYGVDDRFAVNVEGWLDRRWEIVPHAKTQSARISQGPLQRRLGLATAHIDTTPGPISWTIPHLEGPEARDLVMAQMVRAERLRSGGQDPLDHDPLNQGPLN